MHVFQRSVVTKAAPRTSFGESILRRRIISVISLDEPGPIELVLRRGEWNVRIEIIHSLGTGQELDPDVPRTLDAVKARRS